MNPQISKKWWLSIVVAAGLLAVAWVVGVVVAQEPEPAALTTPLGGSPTWTFSYQGQLNDGGQPAGGYYDFIISVWDASTLGSQVGSANYRAGYAEWGQTSA